MLCIQQTYFLSVGYTTTLHSRAFLEVRCGQSSDQCNVGKSDLCRYLDWSLKVFHAQSPTSFPLPTTWNGDRPESTHESYLLKTMEQDEEACVPESPWGKSHPTGNTHTGISVEQVRNFHCIRLLRFQGLSTENS